MDPTETKSPSHSPPRGPPELGFHAPADPDLEPDRAAREDEEEKEAEILREQIKEHLHLEEEEEEEEEEKGYDGNFSSDNYNGWGDEGGVGGEGVVNNNGGGWSDWGDDDKVADEENNSGKEAAAAWGLEIEEVGEEAGAAWYDRGQRSSVEFGGGGGGNYPVRPGAEDCSFYIKTGTCKFGSSCKFNHPVRARTQPAKERGNDRDDTTERPGQLECKYFFRSGGCKYGDACRYSHSKVKAPVGHAKAPVCPVAELNFLNLPIRPGEKECPYYMRNGSCKYGANCRFNHPNPSTGGVSEPHSAFNNGGSPSMYASSKPTISSWSSPRATNDAGFVPMMYPPPQAIPKSPEWNGYLAPAYSQERVVLPTYATNNLPNVSNAYGLHQQPKQVDEFPERPGQPDCSYYLKTGDCKFKSNCRYHHPKNIASKAPPCALSDKGLPLRPDQNVCAYYSRYGICKFGPACKFNHPIQPVSVGSTEDQPSPFFNSLADGGTRISGSGNDHTIQQVV